MKYALSLLISCTLSLVITPCVIFFAKKLHVIDYPDFRRKRHQKPTPLLGGLAIFFAFIISLFIIFMFGYLGADESFHKFVLAVLAGGSFIMIGGYLDDAYHLKPYQQIIFPLMAAFTALISGIYIESVTHPLGGVIKIIPLWGIPLSFVWIMGMMYTTKFLDGLDGLVSGVSIIASLIIFVVSLFWDANFSATSYMALLLAGSALGFLIYNFYPAKIFLGEGGSIFLGYMLALLSIVSGSKIATTFLLLGLPIIDTIWVIFHRLRQGQSVATSDRKHFHFSLLASGFDQRKAVFIIYATMLVFGISSLFLNTKGKIIAIAALAVTSFFLIQKFYAKRERI